MKQLNSCISLVSQPQQELLTPTRYWEIYPVADTKSSLLLHLLTGAVDLLSEDETHFLKQMFETGKITNLPDELRAVLIERGYLSDLRSEQIFINNLAERHQEQVREKPIEFFICTTFSCPIGCSYCFEGKFTQEVKALAITSQQIDSIFSSIEKIMKEQKRPLKEIVLFGGEPLLPITMDAVREILLRAAERKFKVSICTSGVFSRNFTPLFCEFSDTISVVRITIDGPKEYHENMRTFPNAFERAVEGIDDLLKAGIPVMTRTNVGIQNIEVISEMAEYFVERGWTNCDHFDAIITGIKNRGCVGDERQLLQEDELAVRFLEMRANYEAVCRLRPVNIFMNLRHLATNLGHLKGIIKLQNAITPLETIKFHGCGATDGTIFVFGVDNKVYTCNETIGKPLMSIGEYHPQLVIDRNRVSNWRGWHKYKIPRCRECKYLLVCGGTCTMTSVLQFGSGNKPICPPIQQIIGGYISALSNRIILM